MATDPRAFPPDVAALISFLASVRATSVASIALFGQSQNESQQMHLNNACPTGAETCSDVIATNVLLPLFPIAVLLALLFALPLTRFLPPRPRIGWALAVIGAVVYLNLATGTSTGSLLGPCISVIGIALARGKATYTARIV